MSAILNRIRHYLEQQLAATKASGDRREAIELAAAVLLAEVMRIDGKVDEGERAFARQVIRERLRDSPEQAEALLRHAEEASREATDYFQFTSLINRNLGLERKLELIESMWRVAYADGRLDDNEIYLISKIADLLHVTHADYIAMKMRARPDAGRP